jgi:hypothetical protein
MMAGNTDEFGSAREGSPTLSEITVLSRSPSPVRGCDVSSWNFGDALLKPGVVPRGRAASPALSDISTLTILSRSPSMVSGYDVLTFQSKDEPVDFIDRPRDEDGRFVSVRAKRAHTPDMAR